MKKEVVRVEICGGIASGKTSLALLLASSGLVPVLENFQDNPFYKAFYSDPSGTAFETELTFLLQHYHQQKLSAGPKQCFCVDFSLVLDYAYASVTLKPDDLRLFRLVHQRVEAALPLRSLLIHLDCPPEVEIQRIRQRQRSEEASITVDYLSKIHSALSSRLRQLKPSENLLVINSNDLNFASDQQDQERAQVLVKDALESPSSRIRS